MRILIILLLFSSFVFADDTVTLVVPSDFYEFFSFLSGLFLAHVSFRWF